MREKTKCPICSSADLRACHYEKWQIYMLCRECRTEFIIKYIKNTPQIILKGLK